MKELSFEEKAKVFILLKRYQSELDDFLIRKEHASPEYIDEIENCIASINVVTDTIGDDVKYMIDNL